MIHLDSKLLIALADAADPHRETALRLMRPFPQAAVSSMAWWEFECGPVSPEGLVLCGQLDGCGKGGGQIAAP